MYGFCYCIHEQRLLLVGTKQLYSKPLSLGNINFNEDARGGFVEQGISFLVVVTTNPKSKQCHSRICLPTLHLAFSSSRDDFDMQLLDDSFLL